MTDRQADDEAAEEAIEDLEAPAEMQGDVAGGACITPSCAGHSKVVVICQEPTCADTAADCDAATHTVILHEA